MKQIRKTTISKIIPMVLVCIYSALVCSFILLTDLNMSQPIQMYLLICSTMLLADIGKTIRDTYNLGKGNYKEIYTPYYVICWLCSLVMLGVIFITERDYHCYNEEINTLVGSLGVIIAEYIGVLMGNKLATGKPQEE